MAAHGSDSFKKRHSGSVSVHASNHARTRSSGSVAGDSDTRPRPGPHISRKMSGQLDGVLVTRRSKVTTEMIDQVKKALTESEVKEADDKMINQFLRATKLNLDQAVKRLKATIAWRIKEQPHRRVCNMCQKSSRAHYLQLIGFTKLDQPIIYSCFAMGKDKTLSANREHMLTTFEQAVRAMPPHVEQWVWICDYHGFGIKDCDPRLAKIFLEVSERHYPERLASFINISTPSLFPVFFRAFEKYIDPYTRSKIKFLNFSDKQGSKQDREMREELGKILEPGTLQWVLEEMAQNRTKDAIKHKDYPYGRRFLTPDGAGNACLDGHDSRGHSEIIAAVESNPSILVPSDLRG